MDTNIDNDMILPDDYAEPAPQDGEAAADDVGFDGLDFDSDGLETEDAGEDTTPPADAEEAVQEPETTPEPEPKPQTIKIKFNHQEMELPVEEAAALAQKGLNYEKAIERAEKEAAQKARDALIAEMGLKTWDGRPITTEAEYRQHLAEQELMEKYRDRDIPEELIREIIENRRYREEQQREKERQERQAKLDAEFAEFFAYFKEANGRDFDPQNDILPSEVKELVNKGVPLKYAYMEYHNKELINKLKIAKQNEENARKAPVGSVTEHGTNNTEPEDEFLAGFNSV